MEDLRSSRAEYQEVPKLFLESERSDSTVRDTLTFRWWRFLCAVSVANILLWALAAWGLSSPDS